MGEGHLFTAWQGTMEELVQNEVHDVLLAVPRQSAKSYGKKDLALQDRRLMPPVECAGL